MKVKVKAHISTHVMMRNWWHGKGGEGCCSFSLSLEVVKVQSWFPSAVARLQNGKLTQVNGLTQVCLCYDVTSCIIESSLHMNETTGSFFLSLSLCWWEGPELMSCCEEDER